LEDRRRVCIIHRRFVEIRSSTKGRIMCSSSRWSDGTVITHSNVDTVTTSVLPAKTTPVTGSKNRKSSGLDKMKKVERGGMLTNRLGIAAVGFER